MKLLLIGGDVITHKGKDFKVSKRSSLNASPVIKTGEEETEKVSNDESAKGNHESDVPDPIDRTKAVELIKEYLSKLDDHQSELLRQESFRDDELEETDQQRIGHYKASAYAANVVYIDELQSLVEQLENL